MLASLLAVTGATTVNRNLPMMTLDRNPCPLLCIYLKPVPTCSFPGSLYHHTYSWVVTNRLLTLLLFLQLRSRAGLTSSSL